MSEPIPLYALDGLASAYPKPWFTHVKERETVPDKQAIFRARYARSIFDADVVLLLTPSSRAATGNHISEQKNKAELGQRGVTNHYQIAQSGL